MGNPWPAWRILVGRSWRMKIFLLGASEHWCYHSQEDRVYFLPADLSFHCWMLMEWYIDYDSDQKMGSEGYLEHLTICAASYPQTSVA